MIKKFFAKIGRLAYEKLFIINDSPHKIALGFGLGLFSGMLPGTGPLAALFLAFIFKANRATALFGCLLTNTWLSFIALLLAIKTGAFIFGIQWQTLHQTWVTIIKGFKWKLLLKSSALEIILPVVTGYLLIALALGIIAYLISITVILILRKRNKLAKSVH